MAENNLKEIRKLSPGDRIRRLKQLEQEKRREIVEAEKMIEDSIAEIRDERIREEVEVPRSEDVDISRHFRSEESSRLEEVAQEAKGKGVEEAVTQYAARLEELREGIYENPARAYEFVQEAKEQMERLGEITQSYTLSGAAQRAFNVASSIYDGLKRYKVR